MFTLCLLLLASVAVGQEPELVLTPGDVHNPWEFDLDEYRLWEAIKDRQHYEKRWELYNVYRFVEDGGNWKRRDPGRPAKMEWTTDWSPVMNPPRGLSAKGRAIYGGMIAKAKEYHELLNEYKRRAREQRTRATADLFD